MNATKISAVRKMSVKVIMGGINIRKAVAKEEIKNGEELARIAGVVTGYRPVQTDFGLSHGFQGQFYAVRTEDGAEFASSELFLDKKTEAVVKAKIDRDGECEITIAISIEVNDDLPMGYAYVVTPVGMVNVDRWERLKARLLPAPASQQLPHYAGEQERLKASLLPAPASQQLPHYAGEPNDELPIADVADEKPKKN